MFKNETGFLIGSIVNFVKIRIFLVCLGNRTGKLLEIFFHILETGFKKMELNKKHRYVEKETIIMKKTGILNSEISRVLSSLGHTDCIAIADCGLPIPDETERIDLALTLGEPGFIRTLEAVTADMKVEKIFLAEEIKKYNPQIVSEMKVLLEESRAEVEFVSHAELKEKTRSCRAVIRTGEATPYANIILQAGCIFA